MIATTIEQSKHLLELGLDPNTADMFYFSYGMFQPMKLHVGKILEDVVTGKRQWAIPAWSLTVLLEMANHIDGIYPTIDSQVTSDDLWQIVMFSYEKGCIYESGCQGKTLLEAAFKMVCWLLEQGLIKKGEQDEND